MTENAHKSAAFGTNCLDGNPDDAWMNFEPDGVIGNNCPNDEKSFEPPLSSSTGNNQICCRKCSIFVEGSK